MRKILLGALALLVSTTLSATEHHDWEDNHVLQVNR